LHSYQIKASEQVVELNHLERSMNGAPIIASSEGSYFVIGIYHEGLEALKLKKPMYQNLNNWFYNVNYKISECKN
jgi:hypothetical protein